jgi:hypothetical protein
VIDKLDVRVQRGTPFTKEFGYLYRELWCDPEHRPFHETEHYEASGDLRPFGYSAILHGHCKHGKSGADKLELIDTGMMTYPGMVNEIERVYECDARRLEIMRVDTCADIPGVSVQWLQERARVRYKQSIRRFIVEPIVMNEIAKSGRVGTVSFGKKPNQLRIYDKIDELLNQYQKMQRQAKGELPSFEQCFGYPENFVLTRVERQIAGDQVPAELETVGRLHENAAKFDPFDKLELINGGKPDPNPDDWEFGEWCTGMWIRHMSSERGFHFTRQFINRQSAGNASRYLRKFRDFLPPDALAEDFHLNPTFDGFVEPEPEQTTISGWCEGITRDRITQIYRESVSRQLAA